MKGPCSIRRAAAAAVLLLVFATGATADLVNPSTLTLSETSPSRFTVELTLPVVQGRVLKARPVLPDICVIDGEPEVRGDSRQLVRTWAMACDPDDLVGAAIGVHGLLGNTVDVQLTIELLDGRTYIGQLRPTQAYYLVPPPPTLASLARDVGGMAVRQVLRRPELVILLLLCVLAGMRLPGLSAAAAAFAMALAAGQWLQTENWISVSPFLPVILTSVMGLALARSILLETDSGLLDAPWRFPMLMALTGMLYGGSGLPVDLVLSRSGQILAHCCSALGSLAGLFLVILCAGQLRALVESTRGSAPARLRFLIAYLGGVAVCATGLYQASALLFGSGLIPTVPLAALLGALCLGAWCGTQPEPGRSLMPWVTVVLTVAGLALALRGMVLPQATLGVYGSLALVGLLLASPRRWPGWATLPLAAVSALYLGGQAGTMLRESVALPVAQATAMAALLAFLFLASQLLAARLEPGAAPLRVLGLATALAAVLWRLGDYLHWLGGDVAVQATMGVFPLPVLTVALLAAALLVWPRKRRFQPTGPRQALPPHWGLLLAALFTVSLAGVRVPIPFHTPQAPTAAEARPIMDMLLTDTYLAFNLPDEDAAFDALARNLSEDLVAGIYLDSRRRLTAGTRKGAEVTVKDVSVMSVDEPSSFGAGDGSFTYPCTWVVTARVRHWQHIHDRQNKYVGVLTIRVEDDRWKIGELELLSEEREILSWKST